MLYKYSRKYNLAVGDYVKAKDGDPWQVYKIVGITPVAGLLKLISKHNKEGGFTEMKSHTYPEDLISPNRVTTLFPAKYDYRPGDMVDIKWLPEKEEYGSKGYSTNIIPHWVRDAFDMQKNANFSGLLRVKDCHPVWGVLVTFSHSKTSEAYIPRQCLKLAEIEKVKRGTPTPNAVDNFIRTQEVKVKPQPKKNHKMQLNLSYTGWMTYEHAMEITRRVEQLKADFEKYCEEDN